MDYLWIFFLVTCSISMCSSQNAGKMSFQTDMKLQAPDFINFTSQSMLFCNQVCVQFTKCASISFDNTTKLCELHKESLQNASTVAAPGYTYADVSLWPSLGSCASRPCAVNQMCMFLDGSRHMCVNVDLE